MTSSNTLVIVKAPDCSFCVSPATIKLLDQVEAYAKSINLPVKQIIVPTKAIDFDQQHQFPQDLGRFVAWYPTIILFTNDTWRQIQSSPSTNLLGYVFNGYFPSPGSKVENKKKYNYTSSDVQAWLNMVLEDSKTITVIQPKPARTIPIQPQYPQGYNPGGYNPGGYGGYNY